MQTIRKVELLFRVTGEKEASRRDIASYSAWAKQVEKDRGVPVEVVFKTGPGEGA